MTYLHLFLYLTLPHSFPFLICACCRCFLFTFFALSELRKSNVLLWRWLLLHFYNVCLKKSKLISIFTCLHTTQDPEHFDYCSYWLTSLMRTWSTMLIPFVWLSMNHPTFTVNTYLDLTTYFPHSLFPQSVYYFCYLIFHLSCSWVSHMPRFGIYPCRSLYFALSRGPVILSVINTCFIN